MIIVYYEMDHPIYCEQIALFENLETYDLCLPLLEKEAIANGFDRITESVREEELVDLIS